MYFAYLVRTPGAQTFAVDKQWSTWTPGTDHVAPEAGDTLSQLHCQKLVARPHHRDNNSRTTRPNSEKVGQEPLRPQKPLAALKRQMLQGVQLAAEQPSNEDSGK